MTRTEQALKLAKKMGLVRPKDLAGFGIAPVYLRRLLHAGELVQSSRGVYKLPTHRPSAYQNLAEACKRIPGGVVCLHSALHFHGLLKKRPAETWMAIDRKARKPSLEGLAMRFVRFSAEGLKQGVEEHSIEGVPVKVTTCSKTVADCFKYRHKIGMDVALEALRQCIRQRRCAKAELLRCAEVCRISTVIHPLFGGADMRIIEPIAPRRGATVARERWKSNCRASSSVRRAKFKGWQCGQKLARNWRATEGQAVL